MAHRPAESVALSVLELLAAEAPIAQLDTLVEEAFRGCESAQDLESIRRLRQLGLSIHAQSRRRQQREAGLAALVDTARDLAMPYDLDGLLKVITRRARLLLNVDMSYISFPDDEEGYIYVRTSDGHTSMLSVGLRLPDDSGLGSNVLANPGPFWTPDYLADERIEHHPELDEVVRAEGLHAIMGVPLSHRTTPFGVLYVADRNVRYFTIDEIALMTSLGDLGGVAIEKARLLGQSTAAVSALELQSLRTEAGLQQTRRITEVHQELLELALSGGDVHALIREAGRQLGLELRLYATDGTVLSFTGELPELSETTATATAMDTHAARRPVRLPDGLWAAPVTAGASNLGTLVVRPSSDRGEYAEQICRLVAQAVAVPLLLDSSRAATAVGHVRDELLDELLASPQRPPQQLALRSRRLGIDLSTPHVLVIARPECEAQGKAATWANLYAHRMSGLKRVHNGRAVLLLPGTDPGAAARSVLEELAPLLGNPVTVSAAGPVTDPTSVFHGYQEALRCLDAMTSLGAVGKAASARELGFLGVLLADNHDVEGFIDSTIGPVLDYDQQRFTELARTLYAYFETGNSPTYAAQRLHVHTNTVARRLERISELLGPNWQKPDRAFEIQLALKLSRIRRLLLDRAADEAPDNDS
ncbi:helix-turn-helix domain-containing protein [Kitasatospora sp. NPDC004615]|uniref:helix-turn-helix domain-containing protein n=1 Tax=Kitasatospora sp. NPDC004615 TaxID=3364017 RepID=UPI0036BDA9E6